MHYALYRSLTKTQGYDAIMTIRTSPGIILEDYYTGAGKISVRDLELATIDSDSTLGIILKAEEKYDSLKIKILISIKKNNSKSN